MPPVDRNNPIRCDSSDSRVSLMEFMREFPDDAPCLDWLWRTRYSEDGDARRLPQVRAASESFKRYATTQRRQSWTCTGCGHHVHPTAGTIFHKSSTSLHLWFYAMYLMTSTRCGISAKHVGARAWRQLQDRVADAQQIRNELMEQDDEPLSGEVEVDETAWVEAVCATSDTAQGRRPTCGPKVEQASDDLGHAVERRGRVRVKVVKSRGTLDVERPIYKHVLPSSMIFTDEWLGYTYRVGRDYAAIGASATRTACT